VSMVTDVFNYINAVTEISETATYRRRACRWDNGIRHEQGRDDSGTGAAGGGVLSARALSTCSGPPPAARMAPDSDVDLCVVLPTTRLKASTATAAFMGAFGAWARRWM